MVNFFISLLVILAILAVFYLIIYLFRKYVAPLDERVVGIVCFILFVILVVYAFTGHSLIFWR